MLCISSLHIKSQLGLYCNSEPRTAFLKSWGLRLCSRPEQGKRIINYHIILIYCLCYRLHFEWALLQEFIYYWLNDGIDGAYQFWFYKMLCLSIILLAALPNRMLILDFSPGVRMMTGLPTVQTGQATASPPAYPGAHWRRNGWSTASCFTSPGPGKRGPSSCPYRLISCATRSWKRSGWKRECQGSSGLAKLRFYFDN